MNGTCGWIGAVALAMAVSAVDAHAQMGAFTGYLTGHAGAITGGDLNGARASLGASVSVHEDNGWGAELDLGHASDATAGRQVLDVTTYFVNAAWVSPRGLVRPFATAGGGIMQLNGCESPCVVAARTYDLGFSAGGGAFLALGDVGGLRADARYFFTGADHPDLRRPDSFGYWRVTVGATFIWAIAP